MSERVQMFFWVGSRKFLGYMVTHKGIEVNPNQIKAINDLQPPRYPKEVQKLTRMMATLNRFISRSADRCRPFFLLLHKWKEFKWSECVVAFQQLKQYLSHPPIMSSPVVNEVLFCLYCSSLLCYKICANMGGQWYTTTNILCEQVT